MPKFVTESEEKIRARAHAIWESEGRPHGRDEIHWQRALAEATVGEPAAGATVEVSDVSLIDGIGPKIKAQLAKAGVKTLAEIAAMTAVQMLALDAKLELKGRSSRDEWIDQAKELVAGKAPRAKVDQAKAGKVRA